LDRTTRTRRSKVVASGRYRCPRQAHAEPSPAEERGTAYPVPLQRPQRVVFVLTCYHTSMRSPFVKEYLNIDASFKQEALAVVFVAVSTLVLVLAKASFAGTIEPA